MDITVLEPILPTDSEIYALIRAELIKSNLITDGIIEEDEEFANNILIIYNISII